MQTKLQVLIVVVLLDSAAISGCSRKPVETSGEGVPTNAQCTTNAQRSASASAAEANRLAVDNIDGPVESLFKDNPQLALSDARDWAKRNPKTFVGGGTLETILSSLSEAGAQRINILPVASQRFGDFLVIVALPSDPASRQKIFASDARLREVSGMKKTEDAGQKYLLYPFRNSMFESTTNN